MAPTNLGRQDAPDVLERLARAVCPDDLLLLASGQSDAALRLSRWWHNLCAEAGLTGERLLGQLRDCARWPAERVRERVAALLPTWRHDRPAEEVESLGRYLNHAPRLWERRLRLAPRQVGELARRGDLRPFVPRRLPSYLPGDPVPGAEYTLEGCLGVGGFSEVYLARPAFAPESPPSVVKLYLRDDARLHAEHEVRVTGAVCAAAAGAPGVLPVRWASPGAAVPYVLFDHIDALTLEEHLQLCHWLGRRAAARTVIDLLRQAADVLGVAHHAGYVHRDVKASNVLLPVRGGGRHELRLVDWGIGGPVRGLTPESWATNPATRRVYDRMLLYACTPETASPQQRQGNHLCGPEDDVYSVGVLAIQALSGVLGRRVEKFDWEALLRARRVPGRLLAVLRDCVAEDPRRRPADAGMLAWRLAEAEEDDQASSASNSVGAGPSSPRRS
jgi:serine/threonine-protein kinase